MSWVIKSVIADTTEMSRQFNISEVLAVILANRGILTSQKINFYLSTTTTTSIETSKSRHASKYNNKNFLHDPLLMKDMENAFIIILEVIKNQGLICIYGDYDVDGVSSTTILYKGLKNLGANVIYYIPDRETEGYGLNIKTLEKLKNQDDIDLFLTCDNGISNIEEVKFIKDNYKNTKIIILDHHEPRFYQYDYETHSERFDLIPIADAIINPKQKDCNYPYKFLSAGAISFKFVQGLYVYMDLDPQILKDLSKDLNEYMVFASIATICDIVELTEENRLIAQMGLKIINSRKNLNIGLYELLKINNIHEKVLTEFDYGYILGPCINASGRLKKAIMAVQLFTTHDINLAQQLANELYNLNSKRKELTTDALDEVYKDLEKDLKNQEKQNIIVVYNKNIHESIAGIVAGKIKENLYKPTIVLTDTHNTSNTTNIINTQTISNSKELVKGSGRSIPSYNMFEELLKHSNLFEKFGGHPMAVGLSLDKKNIDEFRELINTSCLLKDKDFEEVISIDKHINFSDISMELAKELEIMKPLGSKNKEALFATKGVFIENIKLVGKNKDILQLVLAQKNNINKLKAIYFGGYDKFLSALSSRYTQDEALKIINGHSKAIDFNLDIVYSIEVNVYNNYSSVQLKIKDFRIN